MGCLSSPTFQTWTFANPDNAAFAAVCVRYMLDTQHNVCCVFCCPNSVTGSQSGEHALVMSFDFSPEIATNCGYRRRKHSIA